MPSDKPVRILFQTEAPKTPQSPGDKVSSPSPADKPDKPDKPGTTTDSTPVAGEVQAAEEERRVKGFLHELGKFEKEGGPEQPTVGASEFGTWVETDPEGQPIGQSKAAKDWRSRKEGEEQHQASLKAFTSQFPQPVSAPPPEIKTTPVPQPAPVPEVKTTPVESVSSSLSKSQKETLEGMSWQDSENEKKDRWRRTDDKTPVAIDSDYNREVKKQKEEAFTRDFPTVEEPKEKGLSEAEILGVMSDNLEKLAKTEEQETLKRDSEGKVDPQSWKTRKVPTSMSLKEGAIEAMVKVAQDRGTPGGEETLIPSEGPAKKEREGEDSEADEDDGDKPISLTRVLKGESIGTQLSKHVSSMSKKGGVAGFAGKAALSVMGLAMAAGAAAKGLYKLNSFLASAAEEIKAFSPEIVVEQMQRSLMVLGKRMERAREVGPMLAQREAAAARLQEAVEDLKTDWIKFTTPFMTSVLEWMARYASTLHEMTDSESVGWLTLKEIGAQLWLQIGGMTEENFKALQKIEMELLMARRAEAREKYGNMGHLDRIMTLLSGWEQGQMPAQGGGMGGLPNRHAPTRPPGI